MTQEWKNATLPDWLMLCNRFSPLPTILQEFYQPTLRRRIYESIEQLQADLDIWLDSYNNKRTHPGKRCDGRTPMETLL